MPVKYAEGLRTARSPRHAPCTSSMAAMAAISLSCSMISHAPESRLAPVSAKNCSRRIATGWVMTPIWYRR